MPTAALLDVLGLQRLYAPHGVRCCSDHLLKSRLSPDSYVDIENPQEVLAKLQPMALAELFIDILGLLQQATNASRLDFLDISLSDENYIVWTGWRKAQFDDMFNLVSTFLRSSSNRNVRNGLVTFWI